MPESINSHKASKSSGRFLLILLIGGLVVGAVLAYQFEWPLVIKEADRSRLTAQPIDGVWLTCVLAVRTTVCCFPIFVTAGFLYRQHQRKSAWFTATGGGTFVVLYLLVNIISYDRYGNLIEAYLPMATDLEAWKWAGGDGADRGADPGLYAGDCDSACCGLSRGDRTTGVVGSSPSAVAGKDDG